MSLFNPAKAKLLSTCEVPGILYGLCLDGERSQLYGAGSDWAVYRLDWKAEKPAAEKLWTNHENYVSALVFRDGSIISASYDRRVHWTDLETGQPIRTVNAHEGWVRDLALFPDRKQLASVGDDMLVKLWDAETGELLRTLEGHAKQTPQGYATALYAVAVSPDGKLIASGDRTGIVCLWDARTGKLIHQLEAPAFYTYDAITRVRSIGGIRSLCFSPDGKTLAIAGIGKVTNVDGFVGPCRIELWDVESARRLSTIEDKHKAILCGLAFHPSEPWLIAGGGGDSGGILVFCNLKTAQIAHKAKPKGHIQRLVLDTSGLHLLTAGADGFQVWNLSDS